jgi:LPS-assembly protein
VEPISRWQYDYNRNRTLEAFGGFEYDNCCWKLRLINRYWVSNDEFSQKPRNEKGDHGSSCKSSSKDSAA